MQQNSELQLDLDEKEYARPKLWALAALLILSVISGASVEFSGGAASVMERVSALLVLFLVLTWCHFDALERGYALGMGMRAFMVFFLFIGFPVYLFRSRGLGGFKAMGLTILFIGAMILAAAVGGFSAYGVASLIGGAR